MNTNRAPLVTIAAVAAVSSVAVLFVVAMSAGWEMMILLVICAGVLSVVALFFGRGVTATGLSIADKRLEGQAEKYRHIEAVLKFGIDPNGYQPMRQLQASQQAAPVVDERYTDKRRGVALKLLNATIDSDKYGAKSQKVMTQADAAQVGIIADDWSSGVGYLCAYFNVITGNKGTLITNDKTASRIMADVAAVQQTVTDSAVMALPESKR